MDEKDFRLLAAVHRDARQSYQSIARSIHLSAPAAATTLVISSLNFQPRETPISGSYISMVLTAAAGNLDDVVVIGYGSASRRSLSSAITTIKPEDLNKGAITDVGQLLQGKAPGLNITASGDPNKPAHREAIEIVQRLAR